MLIANQSGLRGGAVTAPRELIAVSAFLPEAVCGEGAIHYSSVKTLRISKAL